MFAAGSKAVPTRSGLLAAGRYNESSLFPARHDFAQTNIQLFNQLSGVYTPEELEQVEAAYDLACELFGGLYRGSGRTFLAHVIGKASIVAAQGDRPEMVAAALLHAAYQNGQFGSQTGGTQPSHRERVRRAVGEQIEALVFGYETFEWRRSGTIPRLLKSASSLSMAEKELVRLRLANELEEYLDLGILYYDNFDELALFSEIYGDTVVELARRVGCDELATLLGKAFDSVRPSSVSEPPPVTKPAPSTTPAPLDLDRSLAWNFQQRVRIAPLKAAIKDADSVLTYQQLDERSDQLAQALLDQLGVANVPVTTLFGHGAAQAIAALGAWKANKIWVPLDSLHPEVRLRQIVEDSGATLLLHDAELRELATAITADSKKRLFIDELAFDDELTLDTGFALENAAEASTANINADNPACIVYTSGSTGTPKGVVHSHRTLLHLARRGTSALGLAPDDRLTLLPSCTQIAGVTDLLRALMNGATLLPFDVRGNSIQKFRDWLLAERPTIYHSSATLLRLLAGSLSEEDRFESVRFVHLGGETVTCDDVAIFRAHFSSTATLVNNLGCSEISGYRQFFVDKDFRPEKELVPAGYPVEGVEVQLCDARGYPVAPGELGEIVVESPYLALGYWQRPEETARVFLDATDDQRDRRYRTGDQGYLRSDGCLIFSGREDNQLQIRGHRVDLAEIEAVLSTHSDVKRVAVTATPSRPHPVVAHIEPADNPELDIRALRRFVRERLPAYMIPEFVIAKLPTTVNDKVDRASLEATATPALENDVDVWTDSEIALVAMWKQCLKLDAVEPEDNFFELGGDSLLVIQLVSQIEGEMGLKVSLREIFGCDTLIDLAALVTQKRVEQLAADLPDNQYAALEALVAEIERLVPNDTPTLTDSQ